MGTVIIIAVIIVIIPVVISDVLESTMYPPTVTFSCSSLSEAPLSIVKVIVAFRVIVRKSAYTVNV